MPPFERAEIALDCGGSTPLSFFRETKAQGEKEKKESGVEPPKCKACGHRQRHTARSGMPRPSMAGRIWRNAFAYDLKMKKMDYQQDTAMGGFFHYNAVPVAASPAWMGEHILVQNNQGTALLLKPGSKYEVAAKNQIGTVLDRPWPVPGQETLSYSAPITDGRRLYLRGERYLYCIGTQ
ncbi:MAG: hypothetical protein HYR84_02975 [Planctomycetes bacterium]|nr:hypothetical protein [Planctomycetota bacterium]